MDNFDCFNNLIVNDFSVPDNPQTWLCYLKDDDKNKIYDLDLWLKTGEIKELSINNDIVTSNNHCEDSEFKTPLNKKSKEFEKLLYEERSLLEEVPLSFTDISLCDSIDNTVEAFNSEAIFNSPILKQQNDFEANDPVCCSTPSSSNFGGRLTFTRKKPHSPFGNAAYEGVENTTKSNESNSDLYNKLVESKQLSEENCLPSATFVRNNDEENNERCTMNNLESDDQLNKTFCINNNNFDDNNETVEENCNEVISSGNTNNNINCKANDGNNFNVNSTLDGTKTVKKIVSRLPKPISRKGVSKIPTAFRRN